MAMTVTIDSGHGWRLLLQPIGTGGKPCPFIVAEIQKPQAGWVRAYGDDEPSADAVAQLLQDGCNAIFDQLHSWLQSNPESERPIGPALSDQGQACELVYAGGGHSGPYSDANTAAEVARRLLIGSKTETTIYVVPRTDKVLDRKDAIRVVRKDEGGRVTISLT